MCVDCHGQCSVHHNVITRIVGRTMCLGTGIGTGMRRDGVYTMLHCATANGNFPFFL